MVRILLLVVLVFGAANSLFAQQITAGPVVGGLTHQSARIFVETLFLQSFSLEIDTSATFSNPVSLTDSTRQDLFNSVIVDIGGLQPTTRYHYRFIFNGTPDQRTGSFRTFPVPGSPDPLKIVVGSCNYSYQRDVLFNSLKNFEGDLFIHLGDWNWPPNPLGTDYNLFPNKVAQSFHRRYTDYNMEKYVLPFMPVDYVYDDDYTHNDNEGWTYPSITTSPLPGGGTKYNLLTTPMDSGIRRGAIDGYFRHFPGYAPVDTQAGIHHSFEIGNVEVFMLDTRNSKAPRHDCFIYDSTMNGYLFQPPPNHSTLGISQRDWLLNGLKNSTADWKIIGSSVIFNEAYQTILNYLIAFQAFDPSVVERASGLAYNWVGYPEDRDTLMKTLQDHGIEDVIFLSGDSHSSMMDDGSNAGLPELSSSGLAAGGEGYLNWSIDSIAKAYGLPFRTGKDLWNGGGSGINNTNFSDTYSTMEFFGSDSVRNCIVDEFDLRLVCQTWYHSSLVIGRESRLEEAKGLQLLYPNPAKDRIALLFGSAVLRGPMDFVEILDLEGRVLLRSEAGDLRAANDEVDLGSLSAGTYLFRYHFSDHVETRKFVKLEH